MSSASEKVAGTAELLEQIVFHLPPHEILLSQRVSRQWKANIATSRRLQRLLFFEPVTDLKMTTKRFGYGDVGFVLEDDKDDPSPPRQKLFANPMLRPLSEVLSRQQSWGTNWPISPLESLPAAWRFLRASWKKMLLSQPGDHTALYAGFAVDDKTARFVRIGQGGCGGKGENIDLAVAMLIQDVEDERNGVWFGRSYTFDSVNPRRCMGVPSSRQWDKLVENWQVDDLKKRMVAATEAREEKDAKLGSTASLQGVFVKTQGGAFSFAMSSQM